MPTGYTLDAESIRRLRSLLNWWRVQPQNVGSYDSDSGQPSEVPSVTFYNASTEEVPAYGVMAVTDASAFDGSLIPYLKITKPSATAAKVYVINGPVPVSTLTYGQCYSSGECEILYDDADDTPAAEETWGPTDGEWHLTKGAADSGWGVMVAGIVNSTGKVLLGAPFQPGSQLQWGKVQSGFVNDDAIATQTVSVKGCESSGALLDADAAAFDVSTPIRANKATALFTDYIVGYLTDYNGDKFIVTDCFDDRMKTVKQWDDVLGNIPDGWSELTAAQGRFIIGVDASGDHDLDAVGGVFTHTHEDHTHATSGAAPWDFHTYDPCVKLLDHSHLEMDHTPPFLGLYNIIRDN